MSTSSSLAAAVLRRVAAAIERMSDEELIRLNETGTEIEIKVTRKRAKEEATPEDKLDLEAIVAKLSVAASRTEASRYLEESYGSKKALEQIARHLDVVVSKQDKVETLRDRLIEATVGARLRSEAIQGGS